FKSAQANGEYKDFYVWKRVSDVQGDHNYVVNADGDEYAYLAYERKNPVLNWTNPRVRENILEAAKGFLNLGVDGFHVAHVSQIMKQQQAFQGRAALSMLSEFIQNLRQYVSSNETLGGRELAVFSTLDDLVELHDLNSTEYSSSNLTYVIDNSASGINNESCLNEIPKCLYSTLYASLELFENSQLPHAWQFSSYHGSRLSTRFGQATANLLTLVQLSLPGAAEIYYGQELGLEDTADPANSYTGLMHWDDSVYAGFTAENEKPFFSTARNYKENNFAAQLKAYHSPLKTFKAVAKLRQRDDHFVLGETRMAPLVENVILFSRFQRVSNATAGGAYLIAANFGSSNVEVNGTLVMPDDRLNAMAEIVVTTSNVEQYSTRDRMELLHQKLLLQPKQGIILRF
ncbi:unnamed protein product, partial [Gongylonema pulchrum]|uniref:Aamy domain-containing protein n=1 Tax=Gongylonema pulchrum TaxID=637853 RepID=A0A183CW26_9BILA